MTRPVVSSGVPLTSWRDFVGRHHLLGRIFGATLVTTGLSVVTSVLLARNLGPEGRGALLALTFWPVVLAAMFSLSLSEATALLVARDKSPEARLGRSPAASTGLVLHLIVDLAGAVLTIALLPLFMSRQNESLLPLAMAFVALFGPLTMIDQHFRSVLQGGGAFDKLNTVRFVQPVAYTVGLSGLAMTRHLHIETVLGAMAISTGLSALLGAVLAGASLRSFQPALARETLYSASRFHVANMALFAATEIDKLLVLHLLGERDIGLYAVAIAVSMLGGGIVVQSLGMPLIKDINDVATSGQRRQILKRYAWQAAVLVIVMNGLAGATAAVWLPLIFGEAFADAVPLAIGLFVMGSFKAVRQILDRAMRSAHIVSIGIMGECFALVASVAAGYLGFREGGVIGFVAGLAVAQALSLAVTAWCVRSEPAFAASATA